MSKKTEFLKHNFVTGNLSELYDWYLYFALAVLMLFGLVMVASASVGIAHLKHDFEFYFFFRQVAFLILGLSIAYVISKIPLNFWYEWSYVFLAIGFFLLILVLFVGREINGSVRWITIKIINIQASEPAKLFIIVYIASYLERRGEELRQGWWGFIKPLIVLMLASALLLAEPDFGAVVILSTAVIGLIFLAGVRLSRFFVPLLASCAVIFMIAISQPYRIVRLTTYMDPWAYPFSGGYQLTQSLIAFGRGGFFGEGLGNSIQKQFYLPEAHTDFIFAVIAEELGLVGALFVIAIFTFILLRIFAIGGRAMNSGSVFSAYVAYGIGLLLSSQILINIGVNTGLLPTKGLALPFVSYGGSNLFFCCMALGLIIRIEKELYLCARR